MDTKLSYTESHAEMDRKSLQTLHRFFNMSETVIGCKGTLHPAYLLNVPELSELLPETQVYVYKELDPGYHENKMVIVPSPGSVYKELIGPKYERATFSFGTCALGHYARILISFIDFHHYALTHITPDSHMSGMYEAIRRGTPIQLLFMNKFHLDYYERLDKFGIKVGLADVINNIRRYKVSFLVNEEPTHA